MAAPVTGLYYRLPSIAPRRRLCDVGPAALSIVEVIAAVLGGAEAKALAQAQLVYDHFGGDDLAILVRAHVGELAQVVGPAQAVRIKAALELGRRLLLASASERLPIRTPEDVAALLMVEMGALDQEQLWMLHLDAHRRLLRQVVVYQGRCAA